MKTSQDMHGEVFPEWRSIHLGHIDFFGIRGRDYSVGNVKRDAYPWVMEANSRARYRVLTLVIAALVGGASCASADPEGEAAT